MYNAKQTGVTPSGSRFAILQDSPTSFHISVSKGDKVIYEHFENPPSLQYLNDNILLLETELETIIP